MWRDRGPHSTYDRHMPQPARRRRRTTAREPETRSPTAVAPVTQLQSLASMAGNAAFTRYTASMGDVRLAEQRRETLGRIKLDFAKAKRSNKGYAALPSEKTPSALGWGKKLEGVKGAEQLAKLWKEGRHDEFAQAVAALQVDLGVREKDVDGVLGPATWARIAGFGEAMAGIDKTGIEQVEHLCYEFTERRMRSGHQRATGKPLTLPKDATMKDFNRIIASMPEGMKAVEPQYRGTGAAGALVYAGLGDFVSEADIWAGTLRPGATLQVFKHREAFDLLSRAGDKNKDKTWQKLGDKAFFYGTSYVFVRYESQNKMLVRHFGRLESVSRSEWKVWVAANTREPGRP